MTRPRTLRPVSRLIWRVWELPDVWTCHGRHSDRRLTGTSGRHLAGAPIEDGLAPPLAVGQSDGGNGGTLRTHRCGRPPRRALVRPSEAAPSSSDRGRIPARLLRD